MWQYFATYVVSQPVSGRVKFGWQQMGNHRWSAFAGIALHRLAQADERCGSTLPPTLYHSLSVAE